MRSRNLVTSVTHRWVVGLIALALMANALAAQGTATVPELEVLQAKLDSVVADSRVPGITVGLAFDGMRIGLAAGMADTARGEVMEPESRLLAGSVGKTFFGALALALVAEGRLDLDAPVARYVGNEAWFSGLPNADDITVRMLMNHTSGIVRYELSEGFARDITAAPEKSWTVAERLAYVQGLEPPFPAGEGWTYSDTNYIILGAVLQTLVGPDLYAEIAQRFLLPLGLENTVPSDRPDVPGLVQGYAGPANPLGSFDEVLDGGRMVMNPQFEWAGGGYASTAEDLASWVKAIHEGDAFGTELLDALRQGVPAPFGPGAKYGLGVIMLETPEGPAYGHSGFMPGYQTIAYYFPRHRLAVALQVNSSAPRLTGRPLMEVLVEIVQHAAR